MFVQQGFDGFSITYVGTYQQRLLAGYFANRGDGLGEAVAQVVDDDDAMTGFNQLYAGMAADITRAAGDEYVNGWSPFLSALVCALNASTTRLY